MTVFSINILDNEGNVRFSSQLPSDGTRFRIGRGTGKNYTNDIRLPVELTRISRDHCSIVVKNDTCYLQDEGSVAGVKVNGVKLKQIQQIVPRDTIVLPEGWKIVLLDDNNIHE